MPVQTRYVFIASMDVDPAHEDLFNEIYDTEHVPNLLAVPGVHAVTRMKVEPAKVAMAGELKPVDPPGEPRYHAYYEIDGPEVLTSEAWGAAVEKGRWPGEVRPHTRNRRHALMKVMD